MSRQVSLLLSVIAAAVLAGPAAADQRRYSVPSFEQIRVEGPFDVTLVTGQPPHADVISDSRTLDLLTFRVDGTTLVVRLSGNGWGETPQSVRVAPVITLSTPKLRRALVNAGGRLTIAGLGGQRVDLAVNGSGSIAATGVAADQLNATIIGTGRITLAGKAMRAQLLSNGSGQIMADALQVNDLTVRLDGTGETMAAARYTATVTTNGLGRVTVSGNPACTVKALAGGPVICGAQ